MIAQRLVALLCIGRNDFAAGADSGAARPAWIGARLAARRRLVSVVRRRLNRRLRQCANRQNERRAQKRTDWNSHALITAAARSSSGQRVNVTAARSGSAKNGQAAASAGVR